ncbi:MAG: hypothetical protein N2C14_22760, partial [Planctomycetales bacterium]
PVRTKAGWGVERNPNSNTGRNPYSGTAHTVSKSRSTITGPRQSRNPLTGQMEATQLHWK